MQALENDMQFWRTKENSSFIQETRELGEQLLMLSTVQQRKLGAQRVRFFNG